MLGSRREPLEGFKQGKFRELMEKGKIIEN